MCGRYTLYLDDAFSDQFGIQGLVDYQDSYNVTPGQDMPVLIMAEDKELIFMRWGLIPSWAKDPTIGHRMINARIETVSEKPSFRAAFKRRRCLVPASGFYEWQQKTNKKQPIYARPLAENYFGFAGLYEHWQDKEGHGVDSFTIITREASLEFKEIHNRMPVIIPKINYDHWLSKEIDEPSEIDSLLHSAINDIDYYPVSTEVNNPQNDQPELIQKLSEIDGGLI